MHDDDFVIGFCIFALITEQANWIKEFARVMFSPILLAVKVMLPIAHDLGIISFQQAAGLQRICK